MSEKNLNKLRQEKNCRNQPPKLFCKLFRQRANFCRHKKLFCNLFVIVLISFLGIFILGAREAQAISASEIAAEVIGNILLVLTELISWILGRIAGLVAGFLAETKFTSAFFVTTGWKVVRDLTNMFFVFGLLAIALATILHVEQYGIKQLLPKLIIAAIIVNFSLVMVGPIIDFAQVLTDFFIEQSGGLDFTEKLADTLYLQKISPQKEAICQDYDVTSYKDCIYGEGGCIELPDEEYDACADQCMEDNCTDWKETTGFFEGSARQDWAIVKGLFASIFFLLIALFAFGAFAFFLAVRIVYLWILLVLAPIVWLLWIFPFTRPHFTKWWNVFIKWVFFAPIYMFFIWLALKTHAFMISIEVFQAAQEANPEFEAIMPRVSAFNYIFQFVITGGMMIGGLVAAQTMGVYGAAGAIGLAKGIGNRMPGWAQMRRYGRAVQTSLKEREEAKQAKAKERVGRVWGATGGALGGAISSRLPGRLGRGAQARREEAERAAIEKEKDNFKNWNTTDLKKAYRGANKQQKAAIGQLLAEKGGFSAGDGVDDNDLRQMFDLNREHGLESSILRTRPDMAGGLADVKNAVGKIKPADLENLDAAHLSPDMKQAILEELQTGGKWSKAHLAKLAENNPALYAALKSSIISNYGNFRSEIKNYIDSEAGKEIYS